MRIKRLALKNIRSYREAEVDFPKGIILFEGDIGSGKSTILYAIELALFGPAEGETRKKTDFYLRGNEKEGWVRLDVEVGGREYSFHRELTRTGSGKCKVLEGGGFTEYAPAEMRKKVLEILGFNEPPGTRSSSVIYRYAVFTPQEEMKEILQMREDDRIQTLRKAFRIEDYKVARENAETAARFFRSRSAVLEEVGREVEELGRRLKERLVARESLAAELERDERELNEAAGALGKLEEEVRGLEELRQRKEKLEGEAGRSNDRLRQQELWLSSAEEELKGMREEERRLEALGPRVKEDQRLSARLEELEGILRDRQGLELRLAGLRRDLQDASRELARAEELEGDQERVRKRMEELGPEVEGMTSAGESLATHQADESRLRARIDNIDSRAGELAEERRGLRGLEKGRCPRCDQELSAAHLEKLLRDIERRLEECGREKGRLAEKLRTREEKVRACRRRLKELEDCRAELGKLQGEAKLLRQELSRARELARNRERLARDIASAEEALKDMDVDKEARKLRGQREGWDSRRAELSNLEGRLAGLKQRERQLEQRRRALESARAELGGLERELAALEGLYDGARHKESNEERVRTLGRLRFLEGAIGGVRRSLEDIAGEMDRVAADIREKEGKLAELARLRDGAAWLTEFFGPAIESIERHVLSHINFRFDELFRRWFGMLVEGTELEVTIDENFTPVVNQGGYELDLWSLSGGEKTSVALAYRLALNHMVKEVSGVDQSNLLILDEPTDGFSTEQLSRVREVLRQIEAPQLILVSHERELENFADHLFRVVKENGASRVEMVKG